MEIKRRISILLIIVLAGFFLVISGCSEDSDDAAAAATPPTLEEVATTAEMDAAQVAALTESGWSAGNLETVSATNASDVQDKASGIAEDVGDQVADQVSEAAGGLFKMGSVSNLLAAKTTGVLKQLAEARLQQLAEKEYVTVAIDESGTLTIDETLDCDDGGTMYLNGPLTYTYAASGEFPGSYSSSSDFDGTLDFTFTNCGENYSTYYGSGTQKLDYVVSYSGDSSSGSMTFGMDYTSSVGAGLAIEIDEKKYNVTFAETKNLTLSQTIVDGDGENATGSVTAAVTSKVNDVTCTLAGTFTLPMTEQPDFTCTSD